MRQLVRLWCGQRGVAGPGGDAAWLPRVQGWLCRSARSVAALRGDQFHLAFKTDM